MFNPTEVRAVRAALFMARNHSSVEDDEVHAVTGVEATAIGQVLSDLDELTGQHDSVRNFIAEQLATLSTMNHDDLVKNSKQLTDLIESARRYDVAVPPSLEDRA